MSKSTQQTNDSINTDDLKNLVEKSLEIFDEPYADPSVLPSYSISKLISKKYKVAISGDGGDELSGGYLQELVKCAQSKNLNNIIEPNLQFYPSYFGKWIKYP